MADKQNVLTHQRERIDAIDEKILELLSERNHIVKQVSERKIRNQLPIFVKDREDAKIKSFCYKAEAHGLDTDWAEDFLRMIMSASRASQSVNQFPSATDKPMHILIIGGRGGMGSLYTNIARKTGHVTYVIDKDDWNKLDEIRDSLDLVIVSVPINRTVKVIQKLAGRLKDNTVLADFTSNKTEPLNAMLDNHNGPVIGLHPMHGPDISNLSKQVMIACPGRDAEKAEWFIAQCELWGMRIIRAKPEKHDHVMHLVQGLRHFIALLHGSFMKTYDLKPEDILDYSSPIYRAELMMTGRIFAQDAELYADIVFANQKRRDLLTAFFEHHKNLAILVEKGDREGFINEFKAISKFFGDFGEQALEESSYLINRLADRFSE